MRQLHLAGEKCFVDYTGQKPRLIDPATGEDVEVEPSSPSSAPRTTRTRRRAYTQQVPSGSPATRAFARRCHRRDCMRSTQEERQRPLPLRAWAEGRTKSSTRTTAPPFYQP